MVKAMAVLMTVSLIWLSALSQASASWQWRAPIADRNSHGAPTHLVAAGDDNGL
ncbi:MAG TPA: hypothetical protein VHM88_05280 [Candidatus Acidoferrales bacterium]|nr:hypothetical protein [Candidatus Acidoferrales bacterium]